jgi:hypothetical protein
MQVTQSGGLGSRPKTWTLWLATGRSLWTAKSQGRVLGRCSEEPWRLSG